VSDCVILLDHRVRDQLATRRLRVVKFRGSGHGTSEFPFLIDDRGFSVLPVTSVDLDHVASDEIVPSGIASLDEMLGRGGFYRGTTTMVSGASGTGKTTVGGHFAAAACQRGERTLLLAFEESPAQIVRNMASVGLDLQAHVDAGNLVIDAGRPSQFGLESHLLRLYRHMEELRPTVVVVDPITDFNGEGSSLDIKAMLMRMVDMLKRRGVTALFTSISVDGADVETAVSSLIDTWIQLRTLEVDGRRSGQLYVLKARGMAHSHTVRTLTIDDTGVRLEVEHEAASHREGAHRG
jgi:circadian clock protein KaiC